MARTVVGTSPKPEMKMIGMSIRSRATRFCGSRPSRVRKIHVKRRATGANNRRTAQELSRGRKGFRLPACGVEQRLKRLAHRDVVVHDEDDGLACNMTATSMHARALCPPGAIPSFCYRRSRLDLPELRIAMADLHRRSSLAWLTTISKFSSPSKACWTLQTTTCAFLTPAALLESGGIPEIDCLISDVAIPVMDGFALGKPLMRRGPGYQSY